MAKHVTIVTPLRDAAAVLFEYTDRIDRQHYPMGDLHFVFVEGDSVDGTVDLLERLWGDDPRATMVTCHTGSRKYASIVDPDRFRVLATVFNVGLAAVDLEWSEYVLVLPVDIQFGPELVADLVSREVDVVAPYVFKNGRFYDIWGWSSEGQFWVDFQESQMPTDGALRPMDTVGGTVLIDAKVLRAGVRYSLEDVDRGFSRAARAEGFDLWADPAVIVRHP